MIMVSFWAAALAITLLLYVLLDGFDLGVGLLFPFAPGQAGRRTMMAAIAPVWDGNETWLVLAAATLFGAFPMVYAILLPAFYLPLLVMLAGLILRGVAFEFREKAVRTRWLWDAGFVGGSYVAAFVQGATAGALVHGIPVAGCRYAGGAFVWATPFAALCGLGLCLGYALTGACWLAGKTGGRVQAFSFRVVPGLLVALLVFLVAIFALSVSVHLVALHRWVERPWLVVFPLGGVAACAGLFVAARKHEDRFMFPLAAGIFVLAFATLAASFLPYMIPFSVTIAQAAAPQASLRFLFWGAGIVALPLTFAYTVIV
jgi:cytochrome d ubiquinol oxidase subunit II